MKIDDDDDEKLTFTNHPVNCTLFDVAWQLRCNASFIVLIYLILNYQS